jgi:4-amino-4-deoxy-L-arabinose transferase-like glycosyltransferase
VNTAPTPRIRFDARDWRVLALVLAGWFALPLLLGTGAQIPLNDDWAYAHTVTTLLQTGEFRRPSWTWVPALTHTGWGALFAKAFGLGFPALRWSSLVAGALGIAGVFTLGRRMGLATGVAALLAATYGFNPVHVHLGFTFMTDVLFVALCVWSLVFLADFARAGGWGALGAGIAFALAATLSRQTALVLPAAFALALLIARPRDWRAWLAAAVCAAVVGFGYLRAEQWLFETGGRWSRLYSVRDAGKFIARQQSMLFHVVKHSLVSLVVLGWFLAPVLLRTAAPLRLRLAAWGVGIAAAVGLILGLGLDLPPTYNVIWDLGLGPITIEGKQFLPHAPRWLWWALTALGAAGGAEAVALLVWRGLPAWRAWRTRGDVLLLLAFCAGFLLPHLMRAPYFDRYAFTLVAPLGAALLALTGAEAARGWRKHAGIAALAFFWLFALAGTRDYLARSEAKWALLEQLRTEGYGERVVVGGVEYNGWFDDFDQHERSPKPNFIWDEEFVLTYAPQKERYAPYAEMAYSRWLPPGDEAVRALRRVQHHSAPAERDLSR